MQSFKWEGYKSIEETVQEFLGAEDPILLQFDVIPLDYNVKDILSPQIFLTRTRLVLVVDNLIEVYNLRDISVLTLGIAPNFSLIQQLLESPLDYSPSNTPLSKNLEIPDEFVRFAIVEKNSLQKEFVLRKESLPVKTYQTWAFAQFIKNLQAGYDDYRLRHMVFGNFSVFNGIFLIGALIIFVVYVLISVLLGWLLPDLLLRILDFLFAVVCIVVLGWMFWTIFVNMSRYRKIYESYKIRGFKKTSPNKQ